MLGSWYNKIKPLLGPNAHPRISFGDTGEITNLFSFALLKKNFLFFVNVCRQSLCDLLFT